VAAEMGPEEALGAVAHGDAPVLETLGQMHLDTLERSQLPEHTYHLVRLAALVALDATPVSYLVNLGAAHEAGVDARDVQGVLTAIAPIVGSARVTSAAARTLRALGIVEHAAEEEIEEQAVEQAESPRSWQQDRDR
jgi:4-carboxymuconolactone decarboxylase